MVWNIGYEKEILLRQERHKEVHTCIEENLCKEVWFCAESHTCL